MNFKDYCYGVVDTFGNYLAAMLLCRNYGAHIVSIQSETENAFVLPLYDFNSL